MPIDWSDSIVVAELADEPALSDEFNALFERLGGGLKNGRQLTERHRRFSTDEIQSRTPPPRDISKRGSGRRGFR